MKSVKLLRVFGLLVIFIGICGCSSSRIPKCNDPQIKQTLIDIISEKDYDKDRLKKGDINLTVDRVSLIKTENEINYCECVLTVYMPNVFDIPHNVQGLTIEKNVSYEIRRMDDKWGVAAKWTS